MQHLYKLWKGISNFPRNIVSGSLLILCVLLGNGLNATNYTPTTFNDYPIDGVVITVNPATGAIVGGPNAGAITLRSSLLAADMSAGPHTVTLGSGTYLISEGSITFGNVNNQQISIQGVNSTVTIIDMATGVNQDRIFFINNTGSTPGVQITINNIRFTNGHLNSDNFGGGAIRSGGPTNVMTITNCVFENNTIDIGMGTTGGAINNSGGGVLSINLCTFTNNTNPVSDGGAVNYFMHNFVGLTGSLIVTNSTFTGNSVTAGSGSGGGAIAIQAQGTLGGGSFAVDISKNTFLNNSATGSSAVGGAIKINNGWAIGNTSQVHFNRIVNNSSTINPDGLAMNSAQGSVDASNNWWGCNTGPAAAGTCDRAAIVGVGGVGTLTSTPFLQLKASASPTPICPTAVGPGNSSTVTASFLSNSAGTPVAIGNLTVLIGLPISFVNPVLGTLSGAQATIQASGTATVLFTSNGTPGNGTVNAVVDNVPNNDPTARATIVIDSPPAIPPAGQPANVELCGNGTANFTVVPTGSAPLSYQWYKGIVQLNNGPLGSATISGATTATLTITNASPADNAANYNVVVTNPCGTVTSNNASLTVYVPPVVNSPGVTHPTCAVPSGTIVVNASHPDPVEYSVNNGTTYQLSNTFSGLAPGNYNIRVRLQGTSCSIQYGSNPVVINAVPVAPVVNAPTVTQPTCAIQTGTIVVNATASGTIEYSIDDGGSWQLSNSFSGLLPGNYLVRARLQIDNTCNTAYGANPVVINAVPAPPVVNPPTVTQPTCGTPTGTIVVNATGGGTLEYSINNGSSWQASATFSGLAASSYNIVVRLQGDITCVTFYSGNPVVINAAPSAPVMNPPTVTQPTCAAPTGTIVVNATGSGTLEYTINGTTWQLSSTFTGLAAGNYNIGARLQSDPTCVVDYAGNPVVINFSPGAPVVNAPTVTQPTCSTPSGTIVVNATGSGTLEYSVTNGSSWQLSSTFSGLAPGPYNIVVRSQSDPTCTSNYPGNPVTIDPVPVEAVINAPTVTQPTCAIPSGTIVVNATSSFTLEYSVNGGTSWQASNTFPGLPPAGYNLMVRLLSTPTCVTIYSGNPVMINAVPVAPTVNAPTITQPNCVTPTGTIVVNATGSGTLEYSNNGGGTWQLSNTFSGLAPGNYNIAARLQADPTCVTNYSGNPVVINPNPIPTVDDPADQIVCNGAPSAAVTFTGSTVPGTVYNWTNNNTSIGLAASGSGNIASFTAINTGTVPVVATITVTPVAGTCTGSPQTFTITVNPSPTVNPVANQTLCNGASTTAVTFSGAVPGTVFNWTNNTTSIGLAASGTGDIASFTATNSGTAPVTATITVTPTANGCNGTPAIFTITVNPTPTVNTVSNQTVCNGTATAAVTFSGAVPGTVYNWTNNTTSIGLAASGTGDIASFTATNSGTAPVTATITVTPTYTNGGVTCTGTSTVFTITVNPTATVNPVANQVLCNGATTTAVTFSGSVPNTVFTWSNNNPSIGLPAGPSPVIINPASATTTMGSGFGTLLVNTINGNGLATYPSTTAVHAATIPGNSWVSNTGTLTGSITFDLGGAQAVNGLSFWNQNGGGPGALGSTGIQNVQIQSSLDGVNFTSVIGAPSSFAQVTASGAPPQLISFPFVSAAHIRFVVTSNYGDLAQTGFGEVAFSSSGSGNIPAFTATNPGTAPVVATITVTPSANGCVGAATTFTYTVNPTPTVDAVSNQTVCNGSATSAVTFSGAVPGTVYNWTNNTTSIGLAASGTGNIASFTATNSGTAPITATITVTPTYTNAGVTCTGTSTTFTITVNPTPTVNAVASQVLCNGAATTAVTFSGAVPGTVFSWTNNTTSIGLAASGTGNIASFTATNSGTAPVTATVTVTPSYTNGGVTCNGTPITFTITVNPTPTVNAVANQIICGGSPTIPINFTGAVPGTVFNWTNNTTSIGLAASGTGNIASFIAINAGTAPVTATITVTPSYTNGGVTCTGTPITFTITVNPTPSVNAVPNLTVCNGASTPVISFSGPVPGTVYSWTNNNTSIGLGASGTGNIPSFTAINTGAIPVNAIISVVPAYTNAGVTCLGVPRTFIISVNPTPTVNVVANLTVCNGSLTAPVIFSGAVIGTIFSWTNNNTSIGLGASGTGNIAAFTAINPGLIPVTATITVTPSYSMGGITCTGSARTFTITVNPSPVVTVGSLPTRICISDTLVSLIGLGLPVGGSWSGIGVSGFNFVPGSTSVGSYTLTYTFTNSFGCVSSASVIARVQECPERLRLLSDNALILYPNPNSGRFNIRINSTLYNYLGMKVMDVNGHVIKTQTYGGLVYGRVIPIDISNLSSGVYMVNFFYDDGIRTSDKTFKVILVK